MSDNGDHVISLAMKWKIKDFDVISLKYSNGKQFISPQKCSITHKDKLIEFRIVLEPGNKEVTQSYLKCNFTNMDKVTCSYTICKSSEMSEEFVESGKVSESSRQLRIVNKSEYSVTIEYKIRVMVENPSSEWEIINEFKPHSLSNDLSLNREIVFGHKDNLW